MSDAELPPLEVIEQRMQEIMPHNVVRSIEHGTVLVPGDRPTCDFCSQTFRSDDGFKDYRARDIVVDDTPIGPFVSQGDWGACSECAALIDAGENEKLLKRAIAYQVARHGKRDLVRITRNARTSHAAFFKARLT